jgi:predicted acyltransferase
MRLKSLDVFRGATIAGMILVNTPGSWSHVYPPLLHADWHGCTPTDLVFPFFVFIVGVSAWFSFAKFDHKLNPKAARKIIKRTFVIFLIGLLLNYFPFVNKSIGELRILGVLQRIALAYGFGTLLCLAIPDLRKLAGVAVLLLLGYWALLRWGVDSGFYSLEDNLVRKVDLAILGKNHVWQGKGIPFDPEGLLSTIPAVVTVIMGYFTGRILKGSSSGSEAIRNIVLGGAGAIVLALIWNIWFPINKSLWTSSFVLYTGGIGMLVLALLYWVIDIKKWKGWTFPFEVFGSNALFVYILSIVWVKIYFLIKIPGEDGISRNAYNYIYSEWFKPVFGAMNGSLLFALTHILIFWLILLWLYRKKIFIKV